MFCVCIQACERGTSDRGACLLTPDGKVFSGCDVFTSSPHDGLTAERAAVLAAVAEGYNKFDCLVVATSA